MRYAVLAVSLVLAAGGCEEQHIGIVVEPRPDGSFDRTIRLWRTDTEQPGVILAPKEELVAVVQPHYGQRLETGDATVAFRGTFRELPADLAREGHANRGGYVVWRTSLGGFAVYRERRPGRTDHHARIERLTRAVDLGAKLLSTIARQQLEGEEGLDRLLAFLEGAFRTDMKDVLVLLAGATERRDFEDGGEEGPEATALALGVQMLEERGYFEVRELPLLFSERTGIEFFPTLIARRMGRDLDEGLRARLAFLGDEERLGEAYDQAAATLGGEAGELGELLESLAGDLINFDLFGGRTNLEYELVLPEEAEVVATSGRAGGRRVRWRDRLDDRPVKSLFYVTWALPDAARQEERLGRVLLRGEELRDYAFWVNSLTAEQTRAWEDSLRELEPGPDLPDGLAAIRVTARGEGEEDEPEEGARILIEALEPD